MSSRQAIDSSGIKSTILYIKEHNNNSIYKNKDTEGSGFFLLPSEGVPDRPSDITGYLVTSSTSEGKLSYINSEDLGFTKGPESAINDSIVRFDGTTGKLVKSSPVIMDDLGAISNVSSLNIGDTTIIDGTIQYQNLQLNLPSTNGQEGEILIVGPNNELYWGSSANPQTISEPFVVAYKGSPYVNPENTLEAYDFNLNQGQKFIHMDIRFTRDNTPILMEDATVNRTTNESGNVDAFLSQQIKDFTIDDSFLDYGVQTTLHPPLLNDTFLKYRDSALYFIEPKVDGVEKIIEQVDKNKLKENVIIVSESVSELAKVTTTKKCLKIDGPEFSYSKLVDTLRNNNVYQGTGKDEYFGYDLKIKGDLAVVSSDSDNRIYTFKYNGTRWIQNTQIFEINTINKFSIYDLYEIAGEMYLAIGVINNDDIGTIQIYKMIVNEWVLEQTLVPPGAQSGNNSTNCFVYENFLFHGLQVYQDGAGVVVCYKRNGTQWEFFKNIQANGIVRSDRFGRYMVMDNNILVVVAITDSTVATNAGAVYVFKYENDDFTEIQKIAPSELNENDTLCEAGSISLNDNILTLGTSINSTISPYNGVVFSYQFNGEQFDNKQVLRPSDTSAYLRYGKSISILNNGIDKVLIVGATEDSGFSLKGGACYIYKFIANSWVFDTKLYASNITPYVNFGFSSSVYGTSLIVSLRRDDDKTKEGSVTYFEYEGGSFVEKQYIRPYKNLVNDFFFNTFDTNGSWLVAANSSEIISPGLVAFYQWENEQWIPKQYLVPDDLPDNSYIGTSLSISGNLVAVSQTEIDTGSVYCYQWNGQQWEQIQKIIPSDLSGTVYFGQSISIYENKMAISASEDNTGSVYIYNWDGSQWIQIQKIIPLDGSPGDQFGYNLKLYKDFLAIGSPSNFSQGAAYLYDWDGSEFIFNTKLQRLSGSQINFAEYVCIYEDKLLISYSYNKEAYYYKRFGPSWVYIQTIQSPDISFTHFELQNNGLWGDHLIFNNYDYDNTFSNVGAIIYFKYDSTTDTFKYKKIIESPVQQNNYLFGFGNNIVYNDFLYTGVIKDDDDRGVLYTFKFEYNLTTDYSSYNYVAFNNSKPLEDSTIFVNLLGDTKSIVYDIIKQEDWESYKSIGVSGCFSEDSLYTGNLHYKLKNDPYSSLRWYPGIITNAGERPVSLQFGRLNLKDTETGLNVILEGWSANPHPLLNNPTFYINVVYYANVTAPGIPSNGESYIGYAFLCNNENFSENTSPVGTTGYYLKYYFNHTTNLELYKIDGPNLVQLGSSSGGNGIINGGNPDTEPSLAATHRTGVVQIEITSTQVRVDVNGNSVTTSDVSPGRNSYNYFTRNPLGDTWNVMYNSFSF